MIFKEVYPSSWFHHSTFVCIGHMTEMPQSLGVLNEYVNPYPYKRLQNIKVAICNHQADCCTCGSMSDLVICSLRVECGHT